MGQKEANTNTSMAVRKDGPKEATTEALILDTMSSQGSIITIPLKDLNSPSRAVQSKMIPENETPCFPRSPVNRSESTSKKKITQPKKTDKALPYITKNKESVKLNQKSTLSKSKQSQKDLRVTEDKSIKGMYRITTSEPTTVKH